MINCIISEHMKFKRTFIKKIDFAVPIILLLISAVINEGHFIQSGSYSYWYTIIFPCILALICGEIVNKDLKKMKYRVIMSMPLDPAKSWISKIIVAIWFSFTACAIFFIATTIGGIIYGPQFSILTSIEASFVIFLTTLWQIPLNLFLTDKFGNIITLIFNLVCTSFIGVLLAVKSIWLIFPYDITSRLMCPIINVLPNALPASAHDPLKNSAVMLPGITISIILFIIISYLTALWFRKKEAR
ncbi:lantibiotic immunity ABC transporter MutE/EpiE family permease subunit [Clostridium felsineum]|uniref:lantibiotic immunity ABC transporter MutE/EpiE family permease subunit n=1 Tax=Clostridium felsineum TaxID=36839 RepID=UPI00214D89E4|nr:lantibiotic immunity ABC transporter MutE/EpiE family permease subunit [Clostridium felsineum]MCR3758626.1 lantibiotic immunity ABC transporter MutE/EpiE family permease subunit [Clostridium felsineum]